MIGFAWIQYNAAQRKKALNERWRQLAARERAVNERLRQIITASKQEGPSHLGQTGNNVFSV